MQEGISFFARVKNRISAIIIHPEIGFLWAYWSLMKFFGREPVMRIERCEFSYFPHFNAFLGAWFNLPSNAEIRFLKSALEHSSTIVDVGANFGVMSCIFGNICSDGQIYAFEPHPCTADTAKKNVMKNALKNVFIYEKAIGCYTGTVGFTNNYSPGLNRCVDAQAADFRVEVTTLFDFYVSRGFNKIDFLKIDAEGADIDVLEGARALFEAGGIKMGLIEVCPGTLGRYGRTVCEMIDFFESVNFELRWYSEDGSIGDRVTSVQAEALGLSNAVFHPSAQ